jgi:hypothetical protein
MGSLDLRKHKCYNQSVKSLWRVRREDMIPLQAPLCIICNRPIENDSLKYVDEDGNPVHEPCYVEQVTKKKTASSGYFQSKIDRRA